MYHRAKHHPSMRKAGEGAASTAGMREAMDTFKTWIGRHVPCRAGCSPSGWLQAVTQQEDCPALSSAKIEESKTVSQEAKSFAKLYAELPKGKKLGNVLVDDSKPTEADREKKRYEALDGLVAEGKEAGDDAWKLSELWTDDRMVSEQHLELMAWAWSPVKESKLPTP